MNRLAFVILAATVFAWVPVFADSIHPTGVAETDTASIQRAVDDAPGGTVTLASGTFALNAAIRITNGTTLVGAGSKPADVVLSLVDGSKTNAIVIVGSSDTVVSNLTVTAGSDPLSGVVMDSGLLVDCVVRDIVTKNNSASGAGVNMTGGTVRRCLITGCDARDSGGAGMSGEGIYMTDGLVENCTITGNGMMGYGNTGWGGAVCIKGKGTLRGCLVAGNRNRNCGTGVTIVGPNKDRGEPRCVVENCTIVGNQRSLVDSVACGIYIGLDHGAAKSYNIVLRNNIVWGNLAADGVSEMNYNLDAMDGATSIVERNDTRPALTIGLNNVSVDPLFADAANGDYHVGYTYCIDTGLNQEWMTNAVDLDGNSRIINGTVDVGCYEYGAQSSFSCAMSILSDDTPDLATVSLECKYIGCPVATASSIDWTLTRQQDGMVVSADGANEVIQLTAGTWDARLVVSGGGASAECTQTSAVIVRASKAYANANGRGEFPYDTVEKGSPSIDDVFPVVSVGGTLYIAEGRYVISNPLNIEGAYASRIESLAGPEKTIIRIADDDKFRSGGNYGLRLNRGDAYVSGVTITGGRPNPDYDGAMYLSCGLVKVEQSGAIVTNCIFRDQKCSEVSSGFGNPGTGLNMSAGTVVDCLFTRIDHYTSAGAVHYGGVICLSGGLADRIRVEECWDVSNSSTGSGGVGDIVAVLKNAVFRNSLVTRCTTAHTVPVCAGVQDGGTPGTFPGGAIVNCTIVANTNAQVKVSDDKGEYRHEAGVMVNGGTLVNCIVADNWSVDPGTVSNIYNTRDIATGISYTLVNDRAGDTTFVTAENHNIAVAAGARIFRRPSSGDYSPATGSPAINAGLLEDWMEMALDLAGKPRVVSKKPDLGCIEAYPMSFSIRLR